jgi:hypothetical protein
VQIIIAAPGSYGRSARSPVYRVVELGVLTATLRAHDGRVTTVPCKALSGM